MDNTKIIRVVRLTFSEGTIDVFEKLYAKYAEAMLLNRAALVLN